MNILKRCIYLKIDFSTPKKNSLRNFRCVNDVFEYDIGIISPEYTIKAVSIFLKNKKLPLVFDHLRSNFLRYRFLNPKNDEKLQLIFKKRINELKKDYLESLLNKKREEVIIKYFKEEINNEKIKKDSKEQFFPANDYEVSKYLSLKNIGQSFNILTTKIKSNEKTSVKTFEKLSDAFVFSLSYNFSYPLIEVKSKHDRPIRRGDRIKRGERRGNIRKTPLNINSPKKSYDKVLVHYFQQALSAESPMLIYLSYYQCLEYFYLKIFKKEMINKVKNMLSSPDSIDYYNQYSDEEISNMIDYVQNKERYSTEKDSLILVLNEYLNEFKLVSDLKKYGGSDFNLVFNNKVNFADAPPLNNSTTLSKKTLASRIYDVRNALVHSKDGKENSYEPFNREHEKELGRELLLIRLVAEQIIENSAKEIRRI